MINYNGLFLLFAGLLLLVVSCDSNGDAVPDNSKEQARQAQVQKESEMAFNALMQRHLDAVTNRDLETLASTLSPEGDMQLILPATEIIRTNEGFLQYHRDWFVDTTFTFTTKIIETKVGPKYGMAITEVVYGEPERNGKPYWNRMTVSYDLIKINDQWYVMKDHASSVEKSTDVKPEQ